MLTNSPKTSSLSVGVSYRAQKGKTGENLKDSLIQEVLQIQCCRMCLDLLASSVIVKSDCCKSCLCKQCLELQAVCDKCKEIGQISHYPTLRACQRCLEKGVQCTKLIVLTWSVDCESGNRKMADLINGEHTQFLDLLLVVPDAVLGKDLQMFMGNWILLLGDRDRSTLGMLRTLRNDCNITVRETLHKLISAESVRNKDRMAVEPLLELTSEKLIAFLGVIENVFVTMTLIPDRYRISETNKRGLYEQPFAICTA